MNTGQRVMEIELSNPRRQESPARQRSTIYTCLVRTILNIAALASVVVAAMYGQVSEKVEFEAASIKTNEPASFHFAGDTMTGGPGTPDPGIFRCSRCSLSSLILRAFDLQPYQLPNRVSLKESTYDIVARIPAGATPADFSIMLQNLLKDRFNLTSHFQEKKMSGYRLVIARNGSKLKESTGASLQAEAHSHNGAIMFGSSATYRGANQSIADLARVLSDQIGFPGRRWKPALWESTIFRCAGLALASRPEAVMPTAHIPVLDTRMAMEPAQPLAPPPVFQDALQEQLGLRLIATEQAIARLLIIDRVSQHPTEN